MRIGDLDRIERQGRAQRRYNRYLIRVGIIAAVLAVLAIGAAIAFCVAQAAASAGFLALTLAYTPLDILSLLCVIYWLSFFTTGSTYAAAKDMRL